MTGEQRLVQALKLVRGTGGMNLTHLGNTLVSRQARALLRDELITYGSGSVAYRVTPKGDRFLSEHCAEPGCFSKVGACSHS